ncbi:hypothetical protein CLOM_g2661 [Closterium sp. NIES-68]|nr:hypothetical protein CLOM_g2661 [Closterium sp. NIES-68]GJP79169.1 hypothetical protein CLOP_g9410 [Closterium sp. NIES-67]
MAKSARGKELLELYDKLQSAAGKAADSPADEDRALDLLAQMADCRVSTEILMETQMGKLVRKLTKHACAGIQKGAGKLVEQWKQVVAAEARGGGGGGGGEKEQERGRKEGEREGKGGEGKRSGESEDRADGGKERGKEGRGGGDGREDRGGAGNGVKDRDGGKGRESGKEAGKEIGKRKDAAPFKVKVLVKTGDAMRDRPREAVLQALCLVAGEVDGEEEQRAREVDVAAVAVEVETELWRKYGNTKDLKDYKNKFRSISFNLKDPSNPDLRRRVLLGDVSAVDLAVMPPEEMASDARRRENDEVKKKKTWEAMRGQTVGATTDMFKCGKCGQRKTTYFQMQTRSADEPMTTYVTCLHCQNRWKFC